MSGIIVALISRSCRPVSRPVSLGVRSLRVFLAVLVTKGACSVWAQLIGRDFCFVAQIALFLLNVYGCGLGIRGFAWDDRMIPAICGLILNALLAVSFCWFLIELACF